MKAALIALALPLLAFAAPSYPGQQILNDVFKPVDGDEGSA